MRSSRGGRGGSKTGRPWVNAAAKTSATGGAATICGGHGTATPYSSASPAEAAGAGGASALVRGAAALAEAGAAITGCGDADGATTDAGAAHAATPPTTTAIDAAE